MAKIPGLNISAPVVPSQDTDLYPSHYAKFGQGGWREVATIEERDAITIPRREAGMAVYVTSEGKLYILNADLTTWSEFVSGTSDLVVRQLEVLPSYSGGEEEDHVGEIVQYIGNTYESAGVVNGYFYKYTKTDNEDTGITEYRWEQLNIQPATDIQPELDKKVDKVDTGSQVYGTDENGEQTTYDLDSFGKVDDVQVDGTSVVTNKIASIDLSGKVDKVEEQNKIYGTDSEGKQTTYSRDDFRVTIRDWASEE